MPKANRRYQKPHYDLANVHSIAAQRDLVLTGRARSEAIAAFPPDLIDLDVEIRNIVASLTIDEFMFSERRTIKHGDKRWESYVDVYKVDFEGHDLWFKLKIEGDSAGEYVAVISLHDWDDDRPV